MKKFLMKILKLVLSLTIAIGVLLFIRGICEFYNDEGKKYILIGFVITAVGSLLLIPVKKSLHGFKIQKESRCSKCKQNLGGGSYEYYCDFRKVEYRAGYPYVYVEIKVICPHCGRKNKLLEEVSLDEMNTGAWKYQVEEFVQNKMDELLR